MTASRRLTALAALIAAAALAPAPALADGHGRGRGRDDDHRGWYEPGVRHAPPAHVHGRGCGHDLRLTLPSLPVFPLALGWLAREELRWNGRGWVEAGWRHDEWQGRRLQVREVRRALYELDLDREAFHARFAHARGKLARYDDRYYARRAELERELQRLTWYASR